MKLKELKREEMVTLSGGDKFSSDLGYAVGAVASFLWEIGTSFYTVGGYSRQERMA